MTEAAARDIRAEFERLMRATLADEAAHGTWTYAAVRPLAVPPTWKPGQRVRSDCSKGFQFLCRWAGLPASSDPMGGSWGPYGNSQTVWLRLQHLASAADLLVGDPVSFGKDGEEHIGVCLEPGPDPLLWSDGHQGAPNTYRLSQDHRPAQYLRLVVPDYVPTPADKLRARTDWFAWMAWYQGEGDWQHYGPADKTVRPKVPNTIPAGWWVRRAKFILRRHKGNKVGTTRMAAAA